MSRIQLALNVSDIDEAIAFYSAMFGATPAKVRPGYANFALEEPPLKLVLIENSSAAGSLNHVGIEVSDVPEVERARARLAAAGLVGRDENEVACCYALQEKVWVDGPDGRDWEIYTVLADADAPINVLPGGDSSSGSCCGTEVVDNTDGASASVCCG